MGTDGKPLDINLEDLKIVSNETSQQYDATEPNVVKEPEHYRHGAFEVIDEMLLVFGVPNTYMFCLMNAWKYRSRAPYKGKTEEDMQKASQYMEMAYQIAEANGLQLPEFIRAYKGK